MRTGVGSRAACVSALAAFAVLAFAGEAGAQGLMVTGYADLEAQVQNVGGDNDTEFFFDNHHFNVIAMGNIIGDIFAAAEVEYEHAGEEIALEYGYIGYTGLKNFRIMGGQFIVPFGRFNKDLHPTWINKMVDRPHGFRNIFPQTYSDVGIWLSGGTAVGNGARIAFDAFVVNGLMGEDGEDIRGFRGNDREKQDGGRDNNKAFGGRLGLELAPQGFDIGASIYTGNYSDNPDEDLNLRLFGADAAYRNSGLEIRAEVVTADQEGTVEDLTKTGGYVQAAYLVDSKWEPVVRLSVRNMPGESQDQNRLSFGLNYYISPAAAVRLNYHINNEDSDFESDNNSIAAMLVTSF